MCKTYLLTVLLIAMAGHAAHQSAPKPISAATPATAPVPTQAPAKPPAPAPAPAPAKPSTAKKGADKTEYKGPTETDIRVAYTDRINQINAGTTRYLDPVAANLTIKLVKVDIVECNPVEERKDMYIYGVLVEAGVGAGEVEFKRSEIALIKTKDAWRVQ